MRSRLWSGLVLLPIFLAACGDGVGPGFNPKDATISVQGGDNQVWTPGLALPKPFQVLVRSTSTNLPVKQKVLVLWRVTEGTGAVITPSSSYTDSTGIASATLRLGTADGIYKVEATFDGNVGPAATFTAEGISTVTISNVAPASVRGGDTVTVTGQGFSLTPQNNTVLFAGVRAAIVSGTATSLRVVVPVCVPAGNNVPVTIQLGSGGSAPFPVTVTASGSTLSLNVGQVALLSDPTVASCARLASGASYLIVVENATDVSESPFTFQLLGLGGTSPPSASVFPPLASLLPGAITPAPSVAEEFELRLRQSESELVRHARAAGALGGGALLPRASLAAVPNVGDSANFNVLNNITVTPPTFTTVKAKVQLVTAHAIIYQDVAATTGSSFTTADYQQFGQLFEDPIFPTDVSVFGQPSDVDNNGHIIILFTPVVNALSPKGANSFVAGFFYGCDLLPVSQCAKSNKAEIFYAAVPDPNGLVGPTLTKSRIMQTTPPVLAHEFMHMIHFNQRVLLRQAADEALWLAEALAHTAEDTVGGVLLARGNDTLAVEFMQENWQRANQYLPNPAGTSLLADTPPGTLPERGAGWLFLKYLRGRFGGQVITQLTQACTAIPCPNAPSSAANVTQQTGAAWGGLVSDWSIALWATGQTDLAGVTMDPRYRYSGFDIRRILGQPAYGGVYPLQPQELPFANFAPSGIVLSSTSAYYYAVGPAGAAPLSIALSGPRGLPFESQVAPQLAILRYK